MMVLQVAPAAYPFRSAAWSLFFRAFMSVSVGYETVSPVADEVRLEITNESGLLRNGNDWWAEGFAFFENPNKPGVLCGDTKVLLLGYEQKDGSFRAVKLRHDIIMAYVDASLILSALKRWSKRYGLEWQVLINGEAVTVISRGKLRWKARLGMLALGMAVRVFGLAPVLSWTASRLRLKYADRWDSTVHGQ